MSAVYNFNFSSVSELLKNYNLKDKAKAETRRRITMGDRTGLTAERVTKKNHPTKIKFTLSYKTNGKMKYIQLGAFNPDDKSCIETIRKKWLVASETKQPIQDEQLSIYTSQLSQQLPANDELLIDCINHWAASDKFTKYKPTTKKYFTRNIKILAGALPSNITTTRIDDIAIKGILSKIHQNAVDTANDTRTKLINDFTGNASYNNALATFKVFFTHCIKEKWISTLPTNFIEMMDKNDDDIEMLEDLELQQYLQYIVEGCDDNDPSFNPKSDDGLNVCPQQKRFFRVLLYTGLRQGELRNLQIKDISFATRKRDFDIITIPKSKSKSKKKIKIPLSRTVSNIISKQLEYTGYTRPNDLVFPSEMQKYFWMSPKNARFKNTPEEVRNLVTHVSSPAIINAKICDRAGLLAPKTPHSLRHTFITTSAELSISESIQRIMTSHAHNINDVHARIYNKHDYMTQAAEGAARIAVYFNWLTNPEDFVLEDFNMSVGYWMSYEGLKIARVNKMEFSDWWETALIGLLEAEEGSGLTAAFDVLAKGYNKNSVNNIRHGISR